MHLPLRELYHNSAMQKNASHEIWTLFSRSFLRGIRAYGCNSVQGTPFYGYIQDNIEGHSQRIEKSGSPLSETAEYPVFFSTERVSSYASSSCRL